jgi:hypothetical protein
LFTVRLPGTVYMYGTNRHAPSAHVSVHVFVPRGCVQVLQVGTQHMYFLHLAAVPLHVVYLFLFLSSETVPYCTRRTVPVVHV